MDKFELIKLVNQYGDLKFDEGEACGKRNNNLSINCFNEAEEVYTIILEMLNEHN